MNVRMIRGVLSLNPPEGELCKNVNWTCYESRAGLTTSTTSSEAFNRFLINFNRILSASKLDLRYLDSIYFYEECKTVKGKHKDRNTTKTIKIDKDMKPKVIFE